MKRWRLGAPLHQWIRNQPVRRKLALLGIATAITAALAASAVLLAHRLNVLRADTLTNTLSINWIVAENAIGPVAFQDATAATALLSTLRAKPIIRSAVIDLPGEKNFATFGDAPPASARLAPGQAAAYDGWTLYTSAPIGDGSAGTVYIVADLKPVLRDTLLAFASAVIGGVVLALLLSFIVGIRVRRFILVPVENLHLVARRVAEKVVYDERADVLGHDEIGDLTMTFNRMLDRLQASDAELRSSNAGLNREIANRQRLEGQLLETSRLAGMAQVATGVLHNVGNVLNSVNISANVMRDTLSSNQQFALLRQTTALLKEQGGNLNRFLAENERGKLVAPFLILLGEQIALVQQDLIQETELLSTNIDHIKQIVALQQNHAQGGGIVLNVNPADLFSDALRIAHASITRHDVQVFRDFSAVPEIVTDRHQILQILVNLVTNGVQAVKSCPADARILKLGLHQIDDGVRFTVEDNGVGIAPENLCRIFQHGFTTRKDGHGFGLHSGSLAARNLEGELRVHSEGPNRGARFTLDLPLAINSQPVGGDMTPSQKSPDVFRILVIDDMPSIHEDFVKILTSNPTLKTDEMVSFASAIFGAASTALKRPRFEVDSAMQGEAGLALLLDAEAAGRPYALAFVDMRMPPGWNGVETIRRLWAADPTLQIVICTAYSDTSWEEVFRVLGDSDSLLILKKPFDSIEALQLARALTHKWAVARQNRDLLPPSNPPPRSTPQGERSTF